MFGGSSGIFKFIAIIALIVIIVAFLEIYISKKLNQCVYELPKYYMKINLKGIDRPLYVYNCKNCSSSEICECKEWNIKGYEKMIIKEHYSNILDKSMKRFGESFKSIFTGGTPVNDIIFSAAGAHKTFNLTNPLLLNDELKNKWKLLYPAGEKIKCFITNGKLYFM